MSETDTANNVIIVPLPEEAPVRTERLGAERVPEADRDGLVAWRVLAAPFVTYDVHRGDLVGTRDQDGEPVFDRVLTPGGHATARVLLGEDLDLMARMKVLLGLKQLGCTAEEPRGRYYALDLPPEADLEGIAERLEQGEDAGELEFEIVTADG